jgi:hypothetical protein
MRSAVEIVDAVVTRLQTAQWKPTDGPLEGAFQRVERFDVSNLGEGLEALILNQDRFALVIWVGEDFEQAVVRGNQPVSQRQTRLIVMVSDRVIGDRRAAVFGSNTHPGALKLRELALAAVCGYLIENPNGVYAHPVMSEPVFVESERGNLPGRSCVSMEFKCDGGWLFGERGPGPIV